MTTRSKHHHGSKHHYRRHHRLRPTLFPIASSSTHRLTISVAYFLFPPSLLLLQFSFQLLVPLLLPLVSGQLDESDRVAEHHRREYRWPPAPSDYIPPTEAWGRVWERRFRQLEVMEDIDGKYDGYMSSVHAALLCPNFTESGWALTRAPAHMTNDLRRMLLEGLEGEPELEEPGSGVEGENMPLLVDVMDLNERILEELRPIHEAWAGVPLKSSTAFGLRVYRNDSYLGMHVDEPGTHIISSILHVDHDEESEPWPLVVEDLQGNLQKVFLESGDLLMYESSKCLHGRPIPFNGLWYSSMFIHYAPTDWETEKAVMDIHYRIPPGWERIVPKQDGLDELMVDESIFNEPGCKNNWCGLRNAFDVRGSEEGVGLTRAGKGANALGAGSDQEKKEL